MPSYFETNRFGPMQLTALPLVTVATALCVQHIVCIIKNLYSQKKTTTGSSIII